MTIGSLNRGAIRASCFDATIAARRLENVTRSDATIHPDTREKIAAIAKEQREISLRIRSLLPANEAHDLKRIFD